MRVAPPGWGDGEYSGCVPARARKPPTPARHASVPESAVGRTLPADNARDVPGARVHPCKDRRSAWYDVIACE